MNEIAGNFNMCQKVSIQTCTYLIAGGASLEAALISSIYHVHGPTLSYYKLDVGFEAT